MGVKDTLLSGIKPALKAELENGIKTGKLVQPVDFKQTSDNVWKRLRTTPMTAGAMMVFKVTREEIDTMLREVFTDLKVTLK